MTAPEYIFRMMPKVRGYLSTADALMMASILAGQNSSGFAGGLAEIGVFFGRSFYLMALMAQSKEKMLAIDLFNIGASAKGNDSKQLLSFLDKAKRLNLNIDKSIIWAKSSHEVRPAEILEKTGPVRFFSIDGGHTLTDITSDASLAAETMSEYGVLCFDDFCNPEWPEVTFGLYDFMCRNATLVAPFLISQKKVFMCRPKYRIFYSELIEKEPRLRRVPKASVEIMGLQTLVARSTQLEYLRCEGFAKLGFGRLNSLIY
jgi:hypothetical protein